MKFAVGCPVTNRAWVLPLWFDYIDAAFEAIRVDPLFIMVVGSSNDDTEGIIDDAMRTRRGHIIFISEDEQSGAQRDWYNKDRYHDLVTARNLLLEAVRTHNPDYFLSIDSDILLDPNVIPNLFENIRDFDAMGSKVFLTPPPECHAPNYANLHHDNSLRRADGAGVLKNVDVLMALKLMNRTAYNVDYKYHLQGEDIGWSLNAKQQGLKFAWDGRTPSKHVMNLRMLDTVDNRIGW